MQSAPLDKVRTVALKGQLTSILLQEINTPNGKPANISLLLPATFLFPPVEGSSMSPSPVASNHQVWLS